VDESRWETRIRVILVSYRAAARSLSGLPDADGQVAEAKRRAVLLLDQLEGDLRDVPEASPALVDARREITGG
jgi:hypothetical protein